MAGPKPESKGKKASKKVAQLAEQQRLLEEAQKAEETERARVAAEQQRVEEDAKRATEQHAATERSQSRALIAQARYDARYTRRLAQRLEALFTSIANESDWKRFLECDPLPDVRYERELTAWLSIWRDSPSSSITPHTLLRPVIESCSAAERIVQSLQRELNAANEDCDTRRQSFLTRYQRLLRDWATQKVDSLTAAYLAHCDEYEDSETKVMTVCHHTPHLDYGLWIHSSAKHGRVKKIEFTNIDLVIELPVALQQSRIGIRTLRSSYDHTSVYSQYCGPLADNDCNNENWTAVVGDRGNHSDGGSDVGNDSADENGDGANDNSVSDSFKKSLCPPYHFVSLGGILSIEQLSLPPPAKPAKQWAMREITAQSQSLQVIPYPAEESVAAASTGGAPTSQAATGAQAPSQQSSTSQAPLRVSMKLPSAIFIHEDSSDSEPRFGWWDTQTSSWRQDGITLLEYDSANNTCLLALNTLRPIAIIQPRAMDFPYRQWSLTAHRDSDSEISMMVRGSRYDITISVTNGGTARLVAPQHPLLFSLNNPTNPMTVGDLLASMKCHGLNICPTADDAAYCRKPMKSMVLTQSLHSHLASIATVFDVQGMELNSSRSERIVLFRVRLNANSAALKASRAKTASDSVNGWFTEGDDTNAKPVTNDAVVTTTVADQSSIDDIDMRTPEQKAEDERREAERLAAEMEAKAKAEAELRAATEAQAAIDAANIGKRVEQGYQWHTVMATLTVIDGNEVIEPSGRYDEIMDEMPVVVAEEKKVQEVKERDDDDNNDLFGDDNEDAADSQIDQQIKADSEESDLTSNLTSTEAAEPVQSSRPVTVATKSAQLQATLPANCISESVSAGVPLVRFELIQGLSSQGQIDLTPVPGTEPHTSLRRCLLAHFAALTDPAFDLAAALNLTVETPGSSQHPAILPPSTSEILLQQTIRRALNLTQPFNFF